MASLIFLIVLKGLVGCNKIIFFTFLKYIVPNKLVNVCLMTFSVDILSPDNFLGRLRQFKLYFLDNFIIFSSSVFIIIFFLLLVLIACSKE